MSSTTSTLIKASGIVSGAAVLSKVLGFLRETSIAAQFGATWQTDAYLVAFMIPGLLFASVGASITTVFIPVFSECRQKKGHEEAIRLVQNFSSLLLIIVGLMVVIGEIFAEPLVKLLAPGFDGEIYSLTVSLTRWMLPAIVLLGFTSLVQGTLNAMKHFITPALVGLPYNIIIIASVFTLGKIYGVYGLVTGTILGILSQVLIQLPPLLKRGFRYKWVFDLHSPEIRKIGVLIGPVILGTSAGQLNVMVDRMLASGLPEGSISALSFANRLATLPMGLFVTAIATVTYPTLADLSAGREIQRFTSGVMRSARAVGFLILPMAVGLFILREPIVRVVFQRGAFDAGATRATAYALAFYSFGLLAFSLRDIVNRAFWALQDTKTPMLVGAASVGVNIGLNLILVRYLAHGGLALATSISAWVTVVSLFFILRKRLGALGAKATGTMALKTCIAAGIMAVACLLMWKLTPAVPFGASGMTRAAEAIKLVVVIGVGGIVYFAAAWALRIQEMTMLTGTVMKVLGKVRRQLEGMSS